MNKKLQILLACLLYVVQANAANYYTTSASATLAGNSSASANWTTNTNGITGLGNVTIAATDNLYILNGATVTVTAATTVSNITVSGGTATTLACGTNNLTITGNLGGTCKRTSTGGMLWMNGSGKTLAFVEVAGSSAPIAAFAGSAANAGGGIQIAANITLAGNTTTYGAFFFNSSSTVLNLNGYTASASIMGTSSVNAYLSGSSASGIVLTTQSSYSQTSNLNFSQTTPGTSNALDSLSYSSLHNSYYVSINSNLTVNKFIAGTNSTVGYCVLTNGGTSLAVTGTYVFNATLGVNATASGTSFVFGPSSYIAYSSETVKPFYRGSNITINGGTLNVQHIGSPSPHTIVDTLLNGNITGSFSALTLPLGYRGTLSYPSATAVTLNLDSIHTTTDTYYFQPDSGSANVLANWNTAPDGSGIAPTSLTSGAANRFYIVNNGKIATATASFGDTGVKIYVGDDTGGSLDNTGTPGTFYTTSGSSYIDASFIISKNSVLHYRMPASGPAGYPVINNSDPAGTVMYDGTSAQNVLPALYGYGNLTINNSSGIILTGNIKIMGTLAATQGTLNTNGKSITFTGPLAQTILGNSMYTNGAADQIVIDNDNGVTLASGNSLTVTDSLIVNSGTFTLGTGSNVIVKGVNYVPATPIADSTYKAGYTLVWNDEFNGAAGSAPNPAVWKHHSGTGTTSFTSGGVNYYFASLLNHCTLDGQGHLVIKVTDSAGVYYTGDVDNSANYLPLKRFGYFEAKIMFPSNTALNSVFWLQSPSTSSNPVADDPAVYGTEMDIVEYVGPGSGSPPPAPYDRVNTTVHKDGYATYHQETTNATLLSNPSAPNWHIIGMEWGPTYCKFYTDGVLQFTMSNTAFISKRPEYIVLGNGEGWDNAPNKSGTYPTQTVYDYVRVYNKD